jgi:hypothetical protein
VVSIVASMRSAPVAALLLLAALLFGCGDDSSPSDVETAQAVCSTLVAWTNDVAEAVDATENQMMTATDLAALMVAAVDDAIARTEQLGEELDDLSFPEGEGGDQLADELRSGQEAALADLHGFRAELEDIPEPDPESRNYRKAQLVVELEKPRSLVKPDVQNDLDDPDLEAAIAAEPSCEHVTRTQ